MKENEPDLIYNSIIFGSKSAIEITVDYRFIIKQIQERLTTKEKDTMVYQRIINILNSMGSIEEEV